MDSANKSCVANSSQKKVKEGRLYCEKLEPAAIDEIEELIGLDGRNQSDTVSCAAKSFFVIAISPVQLTQQFN